MIGKIINEFLCISYTTAKHDLLRRSSTYFMRERSKAGVPGVREVNWMKKMTGSALLLASHLTSAGSIALKFPRISSRYPWKLISLTTESNSAINQIMNGLIKEE